MTLAIKITDFLMQQEHFTFRNVNGVEIEWADDYNFEASNCIVEYNNAEGDWRFLGFDYYREKKAFIADFKITCLRDLNAINGRMLKELYEKGKAEYICFVEMQYLVCMTFRKVKGRIIANNIRALDHVVQDVLETPSEFINYTIQYYTLNSDVLAE